MSVLAPMLAREGLQALGLILEKAILLKGSFR
jgi:hypothetical protein